MCHAAIMVRRWRPRRIVGRFRDVALDGGPQANRGFKEMFRRDGLVVAA
jgi:hypothetical protein